MFSFRLQWAIVSAQRLSASEEYAPLTSRCPSIPLKSAQRLSASEEYALGYGLSHRTKDRRVLNAFRHQRNMHLRRVGQARPVQHRCSTPFGIRGICTDRYRERLRVSLCRVLNAFRHQRNMHTWPSAGRECAWCCAQRLSASEEYALHIF